MRYPFKSQWRWLIAAALLIGCYGPKKAQKQLDHAVSEYPEKVAQVCINAFPSMISRSDTSYEMGFIEMECPPTWPMYPHFEALKDSIAKNMVSTIQKAKSKKDSIQKIIITNWFEDSAKIKVWQDKAFTAEKKLHKSNKWLFAGWILAGVFFLLFLLIFLMLCYNRRWL